MKNIDFACIVCGNPVEPGESFKVVLYFSKPYVVCCKLCLLELQKDPLTFITSDNVDIHYPLLHHVRN